MAASRHTIRRRAVPCGRSCQAAGQECKGGEQSKAEQSLSLAVVQPLPLAVVQPLPLVVVQPLPLAALRLFPLPRREGSGMPRVAMGVPRVAMDMARVAIGVPRRARHDIS